MRNGMVLLRRRWNSSGYSDLFILGFVSSSYKNSRPLMRPCYALLDAPLDAFFRHSFRHSF